MPSEQVTRIEHIDRIRKAYIMWKDIPISEIYHEYSSLSGEFDWVIKPIWKNWKKCLERGHHIDIAGIDDTLHKEEYIRRYNPSFVTQRTLCDERPDLPEYLAMLHLEENDLFEVLCRQHGVCGNDKYYVSRTPDIIIDVDGPFPFDIPDWDTSEYGWLTPGCKLEDLR